MTRPPEERLSPARVLSHLGVMGLVAVVMGVVVAGLAIPFAGALGLGADRVAKTINHLPAELETEDLAQRTQIVDEQGNLVATLYDENRISVPLSQISRTMVKAIVAIEDYRFYQHGALDLKGTLRALITNQASGSQVQGGSSITQQLVKLTLLAQAKTKAERIAATDNTYERKIRELRYAIALEQKHSKDWILERYLNTAYFGDGAYGVQSAAQHYFNVNAKNLNLRQSAVLAGLVKNPTGYDPTNYPDKARERRDVVLDRMAQLQVISDRQLAKSKRSKLGLDVQPTPNGCVNSRAPFFCDYVISYLMKDKSLGRTPSERKKLLYSGGLTIKTTVDLRYQAAADRAVRSHVFPKENAIGGLAMVEPGTGEVRAIAQSRPMGSDKAAGQTYLNYVVPKRFGDSNGFSGGSTFKAFVLASAIQQGIPMAQTINSPPVITLDKSKYLDCDKAPYDYGPWTVHNSTTSGAKNMYTGTRESVNTFYAQLEQKTGLCDPFRLAKRMGLELTNPTGGEGGLGAERTASFTLGTPDVSPLEMAEAYATFAARGMHCASRPVTLVEDSSGKTVKRYRPQCTQVISKAVADAVNDVLRGVQEPGGFGYGAGIALSVPSAGKTGTADNHQAVWFVGYTPQLAAASMVAGANSFGTPISLDYQKIGGYVQASTHGSTTAGPIWGEAMHAIQQYLTYQDFVAPDATQIRGVLVTVPSVSGMSISSAEATLRGAGFIPVVGGAVNSASPKGTVAYSSPGSGYQAGSGTQVTIYPSTGVKPKPPPKKNDGGRGHGGRGHGGRGHGRG